MGYFVIWISALAASLLLVCLVTALVSHCEDSTEKRLITTQLWTLIGSGFALAGYLIVYIFYSDGFVVSFWITLSGTAILATGLVETSKLRRREPERQRLPILYIALIAIGLLLSTTGIVILEILELSGWDVVSTLMGFVLLSFLLTFVAARTRSIGWRCLPVLIVFTIALLLITNLFILSTLFVRNEHSTWLSIYILSFAVLFFVGSIFILGRGLKGAKTDKQLARTWSRLKLGMALGVAVVATVFSNDYIDTKMANRLALLRIETTDKMLSMMPTNYTNPLNAFPIYEQAGIDFEAKHKSEEEKLPEWFDVKALKSVAPVPEVATFVTKHYDLLAEIYRAASMPYWVFEADLTKPLSDWRLPQLATYRKFANLLYHSSSAKLAAGDLEGAIQELSVIERISDQLRYCPILLSFIISNNLDAIRSMGLEQLLADASRIPKGLIRLPVKSHNGLLNSFRNALIFEGNGGMLVYVAYLGEKGLQPVVREVGNTIYLPTLFDKIPFVLSTFFFPSKTDVIIEPFNELSKPAKNYEDLYMIINEAQATLSHNWIVLPSVKGSENNEILKSFIPFIVRAMQYEARRNLTDLALAMTAYKSTKGKYPVKLEDLVPAYIDRIPQDPFDGRPLKVKTVQGGLEIYSIGINPNIETKERLIKEPINFYLGKEAYEEFRTKPAREKRLKEI